MIYSTGGRLWWLAASGVKKALMADWRQRATAVALAREYAYWAAADADEDGTKPIYRIRLKDSVVTAVARRPYHNPGWRYDDHPLVMAADGQDLYTTHESDYTINGVTLLANGKKQIHLRERPELASPSDLPSMD
jgi:hypothetical protein